MGVANAKAESCSRANYRAGISVSDVSHAVSNTLLQCSPRAVVPIHAASGDCTMQPLISRSP